MHPLPAPTLTLLQQLADDSTLPAHPRADLSDYLARYAAGRELYAEMRAARTYAQEQLKLEQQQLPQRLVAQLASGSVALPAMTGQLEQLRAAVVIAEDRAQVTLHTLGRIAGYLQQTVFREHAAALVPWVATQRTQTPARQKVSAAVTLVAGAISGSLIAAMPVEACLVDDVLLRPLEQPLSLGSDRLHLWAWAAIAAGHYEQQREPRRVLRITAPWQPSWQPADPQPADAPERKARRTGIAAAVGGA